MKIVILRNRIFKEKEEFMKRLRSLRNFLNRFLDYMIAISFAEAGEFDTAREILKEANKNRQTKRVNSRQEKRTQMRA
ncbi:MAG: hypothetical protein QXZ22_08270 [Sulfolobales archaeon]